MSAFNTVIVRWRDSANGNVEVRVQFKYGDTWQHEYRIGDELLWGGNDVGDRNAKKVVVDGVLEDSTEGANLPEDFEVHIVNNRISDVRPATGKYDFVRLGKSWVVLES